MSAHHCDIASRNANWPCNCSCSKTMPRDWRRRTNSFQSIGKILSNAIHNWNSCVEKVKFSVTRITCYTESVTSSGNHFTFVKTWKRCWKRFPGGSRSTALSSLCRMKRNPKTRFELSAYRTKLTKWWHMIETSISTKSSRRTSRQTKRLFRMTQPVTGA